MGFQAYSGKNFALSRDWERAGFVMGLLGEQVLYRLEDDVVGVAAEELVSQLLGDQLRVAQQQFNLLGGQELRQVCYQVLIYKKHYITPRKSQP